MHDHINMSVSADNGCELSRNGKVDISTGLLCEGITVDEMLLRKML